MLHIQLYRARRKYEALVRAITEEARARIPDQTRLSELKRRKLAARDRLAALEGSAAYA